MDAAVDLPGGSLGPPIDDGRDALNLADMNPETSIVRRIIRNKIVQSLSQRLAFCDLEDDWIVKLAWDLDEMLNKQAQSQFHYMNLDTLESRLNSLLDGQHNVDATSIQGRNAFSSSNGYPMLKYPDIASPETSNYQVSTTTPNNDCAIGSPNDAGTFTSNNPASGSVLVGGFTASRRYLPNGHHRVVANESSAVIGNSRSCTENVLKIEPEAFNRSTDHGFVTVAPLNEYSGWNNHVHDSVGCSISHISSRKAPDRHFSLTNSVKTVDQGDNHISRLKICPSVKLVNHASSFELTVNLRNVHQASDQSDLRMGSIKSLSICSGEEKLAQCAERDHAQHEPLQQSDYLLYNQSNQLQYQKEKPFQQSPLSSQSRIFGLDQQQIILDGSIQANGCVAQGKSYDQSDQQQILHKKQKQQDLSMENRETGGLPAKINIDGYEPVENRVSNETSWASHRVLKKYQMMADGTPQVLPITETAKSKLISTPDGAASGSLGKLSKEQHFKSHKSCLMYRHALCCTSYGGRCEFPFCSAMKSIIGHIAHCCGRCNREECRQYKMQLPQWEKCAARSSDVHGPDEMIQDNNLQGIVSSVVPSPTIKKVDHVQPPLKRAKTEDPVCSHKSQNETSKLAVPVEDLVHTFPEGTSMECQKLSPPLNATPEIIVMDSGPSSSSSEDTHVEYNAGTEIMDMGIRLKRQPQSSTERTDAQLENEGMKVPVEPDKVIQEDNCVNTTSSNISPTEAKQQKLKRCISLFDSLTPEQIRAHINCLVPSIGKPNEKAEKEPLAGQGTDVYSCSLCGMKDVYFDAPDRYCAACSNKIQLKAVCYSMHVADGSDQQTYFCRKCYNNSSVNVDAAGISILKANLKEIKNYAKLERLDEPWVHCRKCDAWQHQICAVFNPMRPDAVNADHICPNCILREIESGERQPLLRSRIPGAKDLTVTRLSDYIEKWVSRCLEEERQGRANSSGKPLYEVPTAEGLVVRVVSSVIKRLEVTKLFRDIYPDGKYPSEFPYKSKAILLFQNIDGVDVCLFGMYVQEFGSGCPDPNRRRICISYIDSVKYFRPKVTAVTGEALRTFVYHEILIAYLDYCKRRGFTSCYIWSCPPDNGIRDYILYCHPKTQKVPGKVKLREWYKTMIRKAKKKAIIAENTNLHDHFFVSECKANITAARLPYFEESWPTEAEAILRNEDGANPENKGRTQRVLRAVRRDGMIENQKDYLLTYKLEEVLSKKKEDYIMIHLWLACKHCCHPISSGKQWVCTVCKDFQLCDKCFLIEQNRDMKDKHPIAASEKHLFHEVQVVNVAADTIDDDEIVENEIFDTRLIFLDFCWKNQHRFNSLRRAKHSTMMILYNLHQFSPALPSACIGCHNDVDDADGWHCLSCIGFDLCNSCYQKGDVTHAHELVRTRCVMTNHNSGKCDHRKQAQSLQDLCGSTLLHAATCSTPRCSYPLCHNLKGLFRHSAKCETRSNGGCEYCQKIWRIIFIHTKSCAETDCSVPRCKDLKEHTRKMKMQVQARQEQDTSRRRQAAKERMRERTKRKRRAEMQQQPLIKA